MTVHVATPTRRYGVATRAITIRISEDLYTSLNALLVDPRNGRLRYGTFSATVENVLAEWVNSQKVHSG